MLSFHIIKWLKMTPIYFKLLLFFFSIILFLSLVFESINFTRYDFNETNEYKNNYIIDDLVSLYVSKYRKPYLAVITDKNNEDKKVLVLGINNELIYYFPISMIKQIFEKNNASCSNSILEILKSRVLSKYKYEVSEVSNIKTLLISNDNLCIK